MNLSSVLTSVLQRGVKPLYATNTGLLAQQTRNTYVLKRKYPVRLLKKDGTPRDLKSKNYVYELIENMNTRKKQPIDVILMEYVSGIGNKGQKISIKPGAAYTKLLLPGLAVYASPDNMDKYKDLIEKAHSELPTFSSPWAQRTISVLTHHLLCVIVSKDKPWTIEKYHIRAAFRKVNIQVPDEAITMPERPITGPDLDIENREFYVTVTINNREKVKVRCRLHHFTVKEYEKIVCSQYWMQETSAIFPEDQPILDSMPKHRLIETKKTA